MPIPLSITSGLSKLVTKSLNPGSSYPNMTTFVSNFQDIGISQSQLILWMYKSVYYFGLSSPLETMQVLTHTKRTARQYQFSFITNASVNRTKDSSLYSLISPVSLWKKCIRCLSCCYVSQLHFLTTPAIKSYQKRLIASVTLIYVITFHNTPLNFTNVFNCILHD